MTTLLCGSLLGVCGVEQFLTYKVGMISGQYMQCLGAKDYQEFLSVTIVSLIIIISMVRYRLLQLTLNCKIAIFHFVWGDWDSVDQEGAINFRYKIIGETLLLPFLTTTPSSRSQTAEEIFELTSRPLGALNLASNIASRNTELQGHREMCLATRCTSSITVHRHFKTKWHNPWLCVS